MHPIALTYTPAALSANGFANDVADVGLSYALTATTAADSLAHIVTILGNAVTNHSAKTFTVNGTDANGATITEGIAGPNGVATVSTTIHFKAVTSVTVSATTGADTFDIGWSGVSVSPTVPLNWRAREFQVSLGLIITGTINVTVQHTFDRLQGQYVTPPAWFPHASLVTKTATADGNYASPVVATRLLVNSVTAGATVSLRVVQN